MSDLERGILEKIEKTLLDDGFGYAVIEQDDDGHWHVETADYFRIYVNPEVDEETRQHPDCCSEPHIHIWWFGSLDPMAIGSAAGWDTANIVLADPDCFTKIASLIRKELDRMGEIIRNNQEEKRDAD